MISKPRFPLLAKVFAWLLLHLALLCFGFLLFIHWQLGLGLDSLLSGSAGDRLKTFGDKVAERLIDLDQMQWNDEVMRLAVEKGLTAGLVFQRQRISFPEEVPANVSKRIKDLMPPDPLQMEQPDSFPGRSPSLPHGPPRPPHRRIQGDGPPSAPENQWPPPGRQVSTFIPNSRPAFLVRGEGGNGYWAGVFVHFPPQPEMPRRPAILLIRSDSVDGGGMFFDFKPWLRGGLAVLALSLLFWTPFVWKISRYLKRLTVATDQIATGRFRVSIPERGADELGGLGQAIGSMAARLDHLVTGQKRFLGDAAHELCAPLARIRTGLGILETRLKGADASSLESIEVDVAELAGLVDEILAFSRAGKRQPVWKSVALREVIDEVIQREATDCEVAIKISKNIQLTTDRALLSRAVGNLIRNASIHGGSDVTVTIDANVKNGVVELTVQDNGPGVPPSELPNLFEAFYRVDRSRSRESGGSGLGLAIVRNAVEACGGEVRAYLPEQRGFGVTLRLPQQPAGMDDECAREI